jgi:hypothetical protein
LQVIPVVFITNRVFALTPPNDLDTLAGRIVKKAMTHLDRIAQDAYWQGGYSSSLKNINRDSFVNARKLNQIPEFQMDCDWTPATKNAYFSFLKSIKKRIGKRILSCTVRLHQYRDRPANGLPPVERGMLMCYNTASHKDPKVQNAILDPDLVAGYLKSSAYPLPLDVALPLFSWSVWFRENEFRALVSNWDEAFLGDTTLFTHERANRYRLRRDTVIGREYFREGDWFRLDYVDSLDLIQTADLVKKHISSGARVVFFDWDTKKMQQHEKLLENCFARF